MFAGCFSNRCAVALVALATFIFMMPLDSEAAEGDSGAWSTLSVSKRLAGDRIAGVDFQSRHSEDFGALERFLIRPSFTWLNTPAGKLTLGYDAHFIDTPRNLTEHRLWQQHESSWDHGVWSTSLRVRLEERFIENVGGMTFRLRPGVQIKRGFENGFYLRAQNEVHVNLNRQDDGPDSGFDQNRFVLAAGKKLSSHFSGELGYLMQYLDRRRDVLRHHVLITLKLALPE